MVSIVAMSLAEAAVDSRLGIADSFQNLFCIVFHLFEFLRDFFVQPFDFLIPRFFCDLHFRTLAPIMGLSVLTVHIHCRSSVFSREAFAVNLPRKDLRVAVGGEFPTV